MWSQLCNESIILLLIYLGLMGLYTHINMQLVSLTWVIINDWKDIKISISGVASANWIVTWIATIDGIAARIMDLISQFLSWIERPNMFKSWHVPSTFQLSTLEPFRDNNSILSPLHWLFQLLTHDSPHDNMFHHMYYHNVEKTQCHTPTI